MINNILENVILIKSTSEHISKYILYYKTVDISINKIKNVKSFEYISKI